MAFHKHHKRPLFHPELSLRQHQDQDILLAFDAALGPAATPPITSIFLLSICNALLQNCYYNSN